MTVSEFDIKALAAIRESVRQHIKAASQIFDDEAYTVIDVAPQIHRGAAEFFRKAKIITLDKDERANPDYVIDLCDPWCIGPIADCIICTEVLEHTEDPINAVYSIYEMLKPGGYAYVTTPYNFRIHGPSPDNWRFTENGLKTLFKGFSEVQIESVPTEGRDLMPIHYRLVAKK